MRSVLRVTGELLVTVGVVVLLFAGWLVVGTGWATAREQDAATGELRQRWAAAPAGAAATGTGTGTEPGPAGEPVLRLEVPRFGRAFTVLEGTDPDVLARGPGRYAGSAAPGEPGNLALAGHRVTRGAPFDAAATLQACDPLVVETADTWWVYRVLPVGSVDGPVCGVDLPLAYAALPGLRVVAPGDRDVLAPSGRTGAIATVRPSSGPGSGSAGGAGGGGLAYTGAPLVELTVLGIVALLVGAVLLVVTRRRRPAHAVAARAGEPAGEEPDGDR